VRVQEDEVVVADMFVDITLCKAGISRNIITVFEGRNPISR